ncbi:MAG TPA: hypothetical protein VGQ51_13470 [Puia sp.]|nr:hypothetical protein [Puia sp.]
MKRLTVRSSADRLEIRSGSAYPGAGYRRGWHVPGPIPPDAEDKIEGLTKGIRIPEQGENLFENAGAQVFAYYDEHKREIVLIGIH